MATRTSKVCKQAISTGGFGYGFFGYVDGKAIHQSRKIWRHENDAKRAARNWERATR